MIPMKSYESLELAKLKVTYNEGDGVLTITNAIDPDDVQELTLTLDVDVPFIIAELSKLHWDYLSQWAQG